MHLHAWHSQETVGNGTACISRCGHQNMDVPFHITGIVSQQPGQEPCPHILEGQGGPVEQFQCIDSFLHPHHRGIEIDSVFYNCFEIFTGNILTKQQSGQFKGDLSKVHITQRLQVTPGKNRNL